MGRQTINIYHLEVSQYFKIKETGRKTERGRHSSGKRANYYKGSHV